MGGEVGKILEELGEHTESGTHGFSHIDWLASSVDLPASTSLAVELQTCASRPDFCHSFDNLSTHSLPSSKQMRVLGKSHLLYFLGFEC